MKRTLKIVSPKKNTVGEGSCVSTEQAGLSRALSEQQIAHIRRSQSTVNTINELARTISHYLNTPLTVLLGKVDLILEATEDGGLTKEEMRKFAEDCKREIFRIDSIVKAFQDLYQVQHKTYPPGVKMLDVEKEIRDRVKETSYLR